MASRFGGGTRKKSWVEEEQEATRLTRELADPRRKKIRIRHARSGGRTQAADGTSASLALHEDGKERVEDLDAAEWEERERSAAQLRPPAGGAKTDYSSKYRGVSWNKKSKMWRASIWVDGKTKCLGSFANEIAAARGRRGGARSSCSE